MPVTFCRQSVVEITADSIIQRFTSGDEHTASRQRYATRMNILCQMLAFPARLPPVRTDTCIRLDLTLFAIAAPVLMFSDLQILHLIQPPTRPSLWSLIPFTRDSPIRSPRLSGPLSATTVMHTGFEICTSPILIFWLYDRARLAVETVNYRIVCATVPRPDLPDKFSKIAAHKGNEDEDTIPGLWLQDGPTLLQQIQYEAENVLGWFRGWKFWGTEKLIHQSSEEGILLQFIAIEREILFGPTTSHRPRPSEAMGLEIRRHAARLAWESQRQAPPHDIDAWIGLQPALQTNSTNTPEPEELFANVEAEVGGNAANDPLPARELVADASPQEPRLTDSHQRELPFEPILEDTSRRSSTRHILHDRSFPAGNNDAFWQYFLHSYTANVMTSSGQLQMWENPDSDGTPPPIRRARMLTSEDGDSRSFSRSRSRHRERLDSHTGAQDLPRHHVTSLSNYPADAFAYHMSMVLTTVMLLPLESLYLRALARGFLTSPAARPGAVAGASEIRADVRSLTAWFGGEGGLMGRARYGGVMLLIWGTQAVISAGVWGVGTRIAVWIGNGFGWRRD